MNSLDVFLHSPRFIVIGGHKCGTSSLHAYLKQHPEILMPRNKGQDLLNQYNLDMREYLNSYETVTTEKVYGEVSSNYYQSRRACSTIKGCFPHTKLVVVLRHPADRAFSHFNMRFAHDTSLTDFAELCHDPEKFSDIIELGYYYIHLRQYVNAFGKDQVKAFLFDLLLNQKPLLFSEIFRFVGVDHEFMPDTSLIIRKGGNIKHKIIRKAISSNSILYRMISPLFKPFTNSDQRHALYVKLDNLFVQEAPIRDEQRESLIKLYREDIIKTQVLLDIDLSHWLTVD